MSAQPPIDLEKLALPSELKDKPFRPASYDETIVQAAGKSIAYFFVRTYPGDENQSKEDAKACARLFVAAPAMLAELIERRARDAAVERLIAADVEYDVALSIAELHPFRADHRRQLDAATAERRSALAAVRGGPAVDAATIVNAEMLAVLEELRDSAAYWSEYDVPLGIVDRINTAIANACGVKRGGAG